MGKERNNKKHKILLVFASVLLIFGVVLSFFDKVDGAKATYGAAAMCILFFFLNEFDTFEIFGLKAKLRERLKEADEIIHKMKNISLPLAELLLANMARAGRVGTMIKRRERYRLEQNIVNALKELPLSDEEIEAARKDCHDYNMFDLAMPIWKNIETLINDKIDKKNKERSQIPQPISENNHEKYTELCEELRKIGRQKEKLKSLIYQEDKTSLADQYVAFINECDYFTSAEKGNVKDVSKDQIEDLKHYISNKEFRRLDVWFLHDET